MNNSIDNSKRIAKNTGYLYLRMFLVTIVNLFAARIVLRALGFDDFGIYNVVGSIVVLFSFFKGALNNATTRFLSVEIGKEKDGNMSKVFSMAINFHILFAIALLILLEAIGVWIVNAYLHIASDRIFAANMAYQFSIITFCFSLIQTPFESAVLAHERMHIYAIVSIVEAIFKLAIAYILTICIWDKLIIYAGLMATLALCICLCFIIYCRCALPKCRYGKIWDKQLITQFSSYSGWSVLVNAADTIVIQGRAIFFNIFLGVVANAALGIANQVFNALALFARNFANAFNPQIFKSYHTREDGYFYHLIFSTSKISYYLLMLPLIPLIANLPFVLHLWLDDYPAWTIQYITAMSLFAIFDAFQAPLWNAIYATGKIRTHQIMMTCIKVSVLPLTWVVLHYGDSGVWALWIWSLGNVACAIVRIVYARKKINLNLHAYIRQVLLPIILTSIITIPVPFILLKYMTEGWTALICSTGVFILFAGIIIFTIGLNKEEKQLFIAMIRNKTTKTSHYDTKL